MSAPMNIQHRRTPSMTCYAPQPTHARSLSGQLATSWSDAFDFTSCSPLTSALHFGASPPMGNVYLPASTATAAQLSMSCSPPRGDYFSFERDYCSNFACCGITLPDMHALVAHFEESHLGASEGAPFVAPHYSLGVPVPQPKPLALPQVNINNNIIGANGTAASGDAPSPNSSVGPETPPPPSHVSYGFPAHGQSHLQLQVQTSQLYGAIGGAGSASSRANSASPYPHSPYSLSPLSAGSPASSGSLEHLASSSSSGSGSGSGSGEELEYEMDVDMDVLMSFDPLDNVNGVHTPLDSTPPSPLAPPIRPSSVLRAAILKNSSAHPDAPPVCLPPSLFSAPIPSPTLLSPNVEKDRDNSLTAKREKKDRRERERERKSQRSESPTGSTSGTTASDAASSSSSGGAVRREKNRKAASSTMSLLRLGSSSSRSSISSSSSSDEGSSESFASGASGAPAVEENAKPEKVVVEKPRAERTGRPERPDKSGKRSREKAYKCPKPGCTKSYLNPNGLKYHCAKGTCTFANGTSAPPTPVTPTTPSIPSIASVSIPSTPSVPSISNASNTADNASVGNCAVAVAVSQPLTPTSLPSSPLHGQFPVQGVQGMYEYHPHPQPQPLQQLQGQGQYAPNGVVSMSVNMNDVPIISAPVRTMRWR